jgi:hypothetical protein
MQCSVNGLNTQAKPFLALLGNFLTFDLTYEKVVEFHFFGYLSVSDSDLYLPNFEKNSRLLASLSLST